MRMSIKILDHLDEQLEKESKFFIFLSKFPEFYEICLEENKRRAMISIHFSCFVETLRKMINIEKEKKKSFFKEKLLYEIEYFPKNFFTELVCDDDYLENETSNILQYLKKKSNDHSKMLKEPLETEYQQIINIQLQKYLDEM